MPGKVARATIEELLAQKSVALVGVSRKGGGFGNVIRTELAKRGYVVRVVHPEGATAGNQSCARSVAEIAAEVGGAVLVTPPRSTEKLVREAAEAGLRRLWIQQGAESEEAIRFCEENGIAVVHHECILMYLEPVGFPHQIHRWLRGVFGRMPS
ncbi:MAG: CoA-binding protein [Pseudomonadota bacterium]